MVSRQASNIVAAAFAVLVLIVGAAVIAANWSAEVRPAPTKSVSVVRERTVVKKGATSTTTVRDQRTSGDIDRSAWERALDPGGWLFLRILLFVLAAFLVGAAAQRILLGDYAIKIGPVELGEIGLKDVAAAGWTAQRGLEESLRNAGGQIEPALAAITEVAPSQSPALQLVQLGHEIEKSLRALSSTYDIPDSVAQPDLVNRLAERDFFTEDARSGLLQIIKLAHEAESGARVSNDVAAWARETGPRLVAELDALQKANTLCQNCKHKIPEEQATRENESGQREPCPKCGSRQRAFYRAIQEELATKGGVS